MWFSFTFRCTKRSASFFSIFYFTSSSSHQCHRSSSFCSCFLFAGIRGRNLSFKASFDANSDKTYFCFILSYLNSHTIRSRPTPQQRSPLIDFSFHLILQTAWWIGSLMRNGGNGISKGKSFSKKLCTPVISRWSLKHQNIKLWSCSMSAFHYASIDNTEQCFCFLSFR